MAAGADPIAFLGEMGDELWVRSAVYKRAVEIMDARREDELKALVQVIIGSRI